MKLLYVGATQSICRFRLATLTRSNLGRFNDAISIRGVTDVPQARLWVQTAMKGATPWLREKWLLTFDECNWLDRWCEGEKWSVTEKQFDAMRKADCAARIGNTQQPEHLVGTCISCRARWLCHAPMHIEGKELYETKDKGITKIKVSTKPRTMQPEELRYAYIENDGIFWDYADALFINKDAFNMKLKRAVGQIPGTCGAAPTPHPDKPLMASSGTDYWADKGYDRTLSADDLSMHPGEAVMYSDSDGKRRLNRFTGWNNPPSITPDDDNIRLIKAYYAYLGRDGAEAHFYRQWHAYPYLNATGIMHWFLAITGPRGLGKTSMMTVHEKIAGSDLATSISNGDIKKAQDGREINWTQHRFCELQEASANWDLMEFVKSYIASGMTCPPKLLSR
jgi:hypothetical protein